MSGWLLSALGHLDLPGYGCSLLFLLIVLAVRREKWTGQKWPRSGRFRKAVPCLWLLLTILILAGGMLYQPNNYDYLTYRFPRILNWCWEHYWHWIDAASNRMNYSATGFEWLMAPLFVFFKTDRLFFIINFVSWLFLPGLVFSVFRRLGVSPRMAWWWMWLLPSGYCYVLQAGSAGNDSFAAVYLLASLHYALKAREAKCARDVVLSCLAAALLSGTKASNLPLLLPCFIALLPVLMTLVRRPVLLTACVLACVPASFLPMALLNQKYTGDWSGDPANNSGMRLSDPVAGLVGNSLQTAVGNLAPPLFPVASWWNKRAPG